MGDQIVSSQDESVAFLSESHSESESGIYAAAAHSLPLALDSVLISAGAAHISVFISAGAAHISVHISAGAAHISMHTSAGAAHTSLCCPVLAVCVADLESNVESAKLVSAPDTLLESYHVPTNFGPSTLYKVHKIPTHDL